ncbi:uncharacterized protein DAT39_022052, partial [Clarias magur]
ALTLRPLSAGHVTPPDDPDVPPTLETPSSITLQRTSRVNLRIVRSVEHYYRNDDVMGKKLKAEGERGNKRKRRRLE